MREILFRGKKDNGDWCFGGYFRHGTHMYIVDSIEGFHSKVRPETVCEFTGLTDKNGVKIFEGDIVQNVESSMRALVQYFTEHAAFMLWCRSKAINQIEYLGEINVSEITVIGNIYDNPELVKE